MARQTRRGSSGPGIRTRNQNATASPHPRVLAPLAACLFFLTAATALGQTPDVVDIHVAPRSEVDKAVQQNVLDDTVRTHAATIRSKVDLVLVPVTVTDPMNRLVTGLDKENFQIFEGKDRQDVRHFSSEDAPISLGVIFDISGSMSSKIERAREAVNEFFKTANPPEEFFLIIFYENTKYI